MSLRIHQHRPSKSTTPEPDSPKMRLDRIFRLDQFHGLMMSMKSGIVVNFQLLWGQGFLNLHKCTGDAVVRFEFTMHMNPRETFCWIRDSTGPSAGWEWVMIEEEEKKRPTAILKKRISKKKTSASVTTAINRFIESKISPTKSTK